MFDQKELERIREIAGKGAAPEKTKLDLEDLSIDQLAQLRSDIDALLPTTTKMDLDRELSTQYQIIRAYQTKILDELSGDIPPNQVAQVMNAVVGALGQVIKLQSDLKREEMFKAMENLLLEAVLMLPDEAREFFLKGYEDLARSRGIAQ